MLAARGDVWRVDLSPTQGHEQRGRRPALVLSNTAFNAGPAELVVVVPMTTKDKRIPLHVRIDPPDGGVSETSFAMCDQIRTIGTHRLEDRWGAVSPRTLALVEDGVRILLDL